ncbi:MAG: hypothetical protein NC402_00115 [Prevotella sp.]|nr:hypothetical protein [Prevotella sp.]
MPLSAIADKKNTSDREVNVNTTITAVAAAELQISDKRVSKSVSWGPKILSPTGLEQRKANLIIDLCREVDADVIVDPQFTYRKRMFGGGVLTVSGYPAKYTNFRSMSDKEVETFITTPEYQSGKVVFINK